MLQRKTFALFAFIPGPVAKAAGDVRGGSNAETVESPWLAADEDKVLHVLLHVVGQNLNTRIIWLTNKLILIIKMRT